MYDRNPRSNCYSKPPESGIPMKLLHYIVVQISERRWQVAEYEGGAHAAEVCLRFRMVGEPFANWWDAKEWAWQLTQERERIKE